MKLPLCGASVTRGWQLYLPFRQDLGSGMRVCASEKLARALLYAEDVNETTWNDLPNRKVDDEENARDVDDSRFDVCCDRLWRTRDR